MSTYENSQDAIRVRGIKAIREARGLSVKDARTTWYAYNGDVDRAIACTNSGLSTLEYKSQLRVLGYIISFSDAFQDSSEFNRVGGPERSGYHEVLTDEERRWYQSIDPEIQITELVSKTDADTALGIFHRAKVLP